MQFYAHTATQSDGSRDPDESRWQLLRDHLRNVAALARKFADAIRPDLGPAAELAGWLHDLGKYSARFQGRLRDPKHRGNEVVQISTLNKTTA